MSTSSKSLIGYLLVAIIALGVGVGVGYVAFGGMAPTGPGAQKKTLRAAFIYIGPIGDIGWTYAHEQGRLYVQNLFNDWLVTNYSESVPEGQSQSYLDNYVSLGYDIIFTTSFGYMDATYDAAVAYPDTIFFHCSGYKRRANMGTYFAEFYQLYYLNGLMAGALTKTGKIGYVAAHLIPEVVRHINAFALGAQEAYSRLHPGQNITLEIRVLHSWYDPTKARQAAQDLINWGADALAFTEDSPGVIQLAEEVTEGGKQIYTFAHYSPMLKYGNETVVSGQLVHWGILYQDILAKVYLGIYNTTNLENVDYWWMLKEGAVEMGADFGVPINSKFIPELKSMYVDIPDLGHITVYNWIMTRLAQMSGENVVFDPFTGPIYANNGTLMVPEGVRLDHDALWSMDWFVIHVEQPSE